MRTRHLTLLIPSLVWAAALCVPAVARAQYSVPQRATGETYRIEIGGGLWNPAVSGIVASEQFGIPPTDIDLVSDLGFKTTRFTDGRLVLRPGKKHKLRVQYTPISYSADSTLSRELVFNGILYPVNIPVQSTFDWKVWRFGYEYDFIYTDRGFFGVIIEGRYTQMNASLKSVVSDEFSSAKAPLPALGLVARVYPVRNISITAEATGFKLPNFDERYAANYLDFDVYGTFNVTDHLGIQGGWRRVNTYLKFENDSGDFKFQGIWFGGAVRF